MVDKDSTAAAEGEHDDDYVYFLQKPHEQSCCKVQLCEAPFIHTLQLASPGLVQYAAWTAIHGGPTCEAARQGKQAGRA